MVVTSAKLAPLCAESGIVMVKAGPPGRRVWSPIMYSDAVGFGAMVCVPMVRGGRMALGRGSFRSGCAVMEVKGMVAVPSTMMFVLPSEVWMTIGVLSTVMV